MDRSYPLLRRLTAFTTDPEGGNRAGVWIGESLPEPEEMQRIAREVGYSETAFVAPDSGRERQVRYYSPKAEVSFCGHATVATGVLLGETDGEGVYRLSTAVGEVPVEVRKQNGTFEASLTSILPKQESAPDALLDEVLSALGWTRSVLDPSIPPVRAWAGAWHLVLALAKHETLEALDYDFGRLERASSYGFMLDGVGRLEEARDVFSEVIRLREAALGPEHPNVGFDIQILASVLGEMAEYDEAVELARRAVDLLGTGLGADHANYGDALLNLADLELSTSDFASAEEHARKARDVLERSLGPEHPTVIQAYVLISAALLGQGRRDEAVPSFDRATTLLAVGSGRAVPEIPRYAELAARLK